jgi:hypothetical protein
MGKYKLTAVLVVGALLVGAALGSAITWAAGVGDRTQILEGFAWVNESGTAIGLSPDGETPGPSYVVAGAMWREEGGPWHDAWPTCLAPTTFDQKVRLGLLEVEPHAEAPSRPVVLWLECLD